MTGDGIQGAGSSKLNAKSEKEAINFVLHQFDTDVQLAEITIHMAGKMNIEQIC